jgi:hypothetical protein
MKTAVAPVFVLAVLVVAVAPTHEAVGGSADPFLKQRRDQAAARKAEYRDERDHLEALEERRRERELDHPEMIFDDEEKPESLAPPPPPE